MSCDGCKHYRKTYEECNALLGIAYCPTCGVTRKLSVNVRCSKCHTLAGAVPIWECPGGVPSTHCPGFEAVVPDVVQRGLFD